MFEEVGEDAVSNNQAIVSAPASGKHCNLPLCRGFDANR